MSTHNSNTNNNGSNDNADLPPWYTFEGIPGFAYMRVPDGSQLPLEDVLTDIDTGHHDNRSTLKQLLEVKDEDFSGTEVQAEAQRKIANLSRQHASELYHTCAARVLVRNDVEDNNGAAVKFLKNMITREELKALIPTLSRREMIQLYHSYCLMDEELTRNDNPNKNSLFRLFCTFKGEKDPRRDEQWFVACDAPYGDEELRTILLDCTDQSSLGEILKEMTLEQAERTIQTWSAEKKTELFHVLGYAISDPPELSSATRLLTKGLLSAEDAAEAILYLNSVPELASQLHHVYHMFAGELSEGVVTKKANPTLEELMQMLNIYRMVDAMKQNGTYRGMHPQWRNYCLAPYDQDELVDVLIRETRQRLS